MKLRPFRNRWIAAPLVFILLGMMAGPVFAQDQAPPPARQPVMQNVFYNVVWGSAFGALLGFASSIESSADKTQPLNARGSAFEGATIGGLIGLGIGVWLVYGGITFDPSGSTLLGANAMDAAPLAYAPKDLLPAPDAAAQPLVLSSAVADARPPFSLETAPGQPGKVTGFRALVMDLRF
jgi:hypothetical protein